MKQFIALLFVLLSLNGFTQSKIYIRGDSVFIQGSTNGELILKNSTRAVSGFLYNVGGGVTDFRIIDTSVISNFYAKVHSLFSATAPVTYSNGLIGITQATTSTDGYLTSTDWNTFNNKQPQLNGTGFVKASGTTISYDNSTYLTAIDRPVPQRETQTASTTSITFSTVAVPATYGTYMIARNGSILIPTIDYTRTSSTAISVPLAQPGDVIAIETK